MLIVGFAGGQTAAKSGLGLPCMPLILGYTAARGHNVVLAMGGGAPIGRENFVTAGVGAALARKQGAGTFGIVCFKAWTKWSICPALLFRLHRLVRKCDFITLHSVYCFPVLAGYILARIYRKPYGLWPHGVLAPFQRRVSVRRKRIYDRLFARRILNDASVVVFTAEGEKEETRELELKAPGMVIPHGFEASTYEDLPPKGRFRAKFLHGHQGPLLVFLARLNAKKGLDLLVRAMAEVSMRYPNARLAIAGPGDPRSFEGQVVKWIQEAGVEKCTILTGLVGGEIKREMLADADVFVLPSHAENFGYSVFEAMACRIPVVVGESLNYAEMITQHRAGIAVKGESQRIAESIIYLLDHPEVREEMGGNGYKFAHAFTWEKCAESVDRIASKITTDWQAVPR